MCLLAGATAACCWSRPAMADTIRLTTGRTISGRITGETTDAVTFQTPEGRFTFSRNRISKISKDPPAQNALNDVKALLATGQLDAAIAHYTRSDLESQFAPDTLNALLLEQLKDSAGTVSATSATASSLAQALHRDLQPPLELLLFGAALATEAEDPDLALELLQRIPLPPPRPPVWPQSTLSGLIRRIADAAVRLNRGDLVGAAARTATQLVPTPTTAATDQALRIYAEIDQLRAAGQYLRATSLFRPELFLQAADMFRPLAERLLKSIISAPSTPQNFAALESARVTIFPFISAPLRASALRLLISRLVSADRIADARAIADDISARDPDTGAVAIHLVQFHEKRLALPAGKPLETYKLAAWAREMGLLEEARPLFLELRKDPRFAPNAQLQLDLIENARCTREVAQLRQLYDSNDFSTLESEVHKFEATAPPEAFAQQARDLLQLAKFQKWSSGKMATGKAEAEFQQAERLANRRAFDEALLHLNRIQADTQNPDAATKARALRNKIIRAKQQDQSTTTQ